MRTPRTQGRPPLRIIDSMFSIPLLANTLPSLSYRNGPEEDQRLC